MACMRPSNYTFVLKNTTVVLVRRKTNVNEDQGLEIDLDDYIGNNDGKLVFGKKFSVSSRKISVDEGVLTAECQNNNGEWVNSFYNLHSAIKVVGKQVIIEDVPSTKIVPCWKIEF